MSKRSLRERETLRINEIVQGWGLSRSSVYRLIKLGELPISRVGDTVLIDAASWYRLVDKGRVTQ